MDTKIICLSFFCAMFPCISNATESDTGFIEMLVERPANISDLLQAIPGESPAGTSLLLPKTGASLLVPRGANSSVNPKLSPAKVPKVTPKAKPEPKVKRAKVGSVAPKPGLASEKRKLSPVVPAEVVAKSEHKTKSDRKIESPIVPQKELPKNELGVDHKRLCSFLEETLASLAKPPSYKPTEQQENRRKKQQEQMTNEYETNCSK